MASLRDQLADELVARIATLPGWVAKRVAGVETTNVPKLALVAIADEDKEPESQIFYQCTLRLVVMVRGKQSDVTATHGNNPFRYLDELLAAVEAVVHAPQAWPHEAIVSLQGHEIVGPDENSFVHAALRIVALYRHDFANPNTYDPNYVV